MKTQTLERTRSLLLAGMLMSVYCLSAPVNAQVNEAEPNDTGPTAQTLPVTSNSTAVTAIIGTQPGAVTTDTDLFGFDATAGDVPSIMVISDATWDSMLSLYDANGNLLVQNDDAVTMNPGSISSVDSRIDNFALPATGQYFVGVTAVPRAFVNNFTVNDPNLQGIGGGYELQIDGVTPAVVADPTPDPIPDPGPEVTPGEEEVTAISIEVRRWKGRDRNVSKRWKKRLKRMGKKHGIYPVPVAMLSSETFDAKSIDKKSLQFGATGDEKSLFRCSKRFRDINRDGRKDLLCYFDAFKTGFEVGDVQGFLNGKTIDGQAFESSAALKVFRVSNKKEKSWHERHGRDARSYKKSKRSYKHSKRRHNRRHHHND